ncbi:hypothetical protein QJS04_geneDACA009340 [Acorus gramineus]|uniref:Uncharacterized protein n=1 Tax=Acorus gramineus TaxID=55184 RepID=A0AAV9AFH0_ACOGR|nr:hypothetical protein QJS04_geneDACA023897 [Acorus gramineus]KAK1262878.1 hypothetical protein QJS04_geneDACA009340 [Acorus gramineus]
MASKTVILLFFLFSFADLCLGSRKLNSLYEPPPTLVTYHNGPLLDGDLPISLVWYGKFTPTQKSIVSDFLLSLTSVSQWWTTVDAYVKKAGKKPTRLTLSNQVSDAKYSLGKSLKKSQIAQLASIPNNKARLTIVLTAQDVAVEGFCMSNCGFHGSNAKTNSAYIWVGNSASQCPGQCAWPFHQPIYGPQSAPLVAPNNDVGLDGMVINIAGLLAGTITNPFGKGYFQGPSEAPVEVASVCPGMYGKGSYPGYAGDLLVDANTGASYNANGANGRKYLLPALFDASTSSCSTLV